jgi:N-acetylneuraminic acid mutarotase
MFEYNGEDLFSEKRKQVYFNCWKEIQVKGMENVGRRRAHAAQLIDEYLYVFGGVDTYKVCYNTMHKFSLITNSWELISTKGKIPPPRCYHDMSIINKNFLFMYGGINGDLTNIITVYSDFYIFNILENVWVEAVVGGLQPSPRYGFCMVKLNETTFHNPNEKSQFMTNPYNSKLKNQSNVKTTLLNNLNHHSKEKEYPNISKLGGIIIFGGFSKEPYDSKVYELLQSGK